MKNLLKGFTLVELLVSIAILSILLTQAVPAFQELLEKSKTRVATDNLIKHLNFARIQAINHREFVILCSANNNQRCARTRDWSGRSLLIFIDKNGDNRFKPRDDKLLRITDKMPNGSSLIFRAFQNKSYLKWTPQGTTDYQNGNFTYCPASGKPTMARHLILNMVGRIYEGQDSNNDGIVEDNDGNNVICG